MVMDASAKQAGLSAYFFFYFVRLFLTLYVLPILLGFVIQAYLGAVNAKAARIAKVAAQTPREDLTESVRSAPCFCHSKHFMFHI